MPKLSVVITNLIQIQEAIGDQDVELVGQKEADIPLEDAPPLGVRIITHPEKRGDIGTNGSVTRE